MLCSSWDSYNGENNHLATAMDPYSYGELLTHHSGGWHGDEEGLRRRFPSPAKCREELWSPRDDGGGYRLLSGYLRYLSLYLGFSRRGEYIGEGGESEAVQWAYTLARHGLGFGPRLGGVWLPCGPPLAHLRASGVFYYETTLNNFLFAIPRIFPL